MSKQADGDRRLAAGRATDTVIAPRGYTRVSSLEPGMINPQVMPGRDGK